MMKTCLLIISNPNVVLRTLPILQAEISNTLYIQYLPATKWHNNLTLKNINAKKVVSWPKYSSLIVGFYSKVLPYKHLDVRVLLSDLRSDKLTNIFTKNPVEIVYYDQFFTKEEMCNYVLACVKNKSVDCEITPLDQFDEALDDNFSENSGGEVYDNVVLGGTFDRLHYGHKILLTEAVLRCQKKITVGVTDTPMLKSKKLWELVEPCELRMKRVRDFLEEVETSLEYDIVPISDIYGPTKDDPTFQMIVVSSETVGGGSKVNEIREANNLNRLCIHQVELMADVNKEDPEEEDKISSSNLRLRCLGTLLRTPEPNQNIPERPYIIGLTGGIASGKSNIASYLGNLGAGVINCDILGHEMYQQGTEGHSSVVALFGKEILDESGDINRKKLGAIVFNNKDKLNALNELLWPLILQEAQARAQNLLSEGHQVVILEAAVLAQAGWQQYCHELWVTIVPPEEAVKRVMKRNKLTEAEVKVRLDAQPTNSEYVRLANIVFCSLWRQEFTYKQVMKAWTNLRQRLSLQ